jgi:ABC-type transport system involved in multi-copper enzyme maturation permease subunit
MKYLAILKDSLREALDSSVLYVMIGLSALVILFVSTLSFKPLPAKKTMDKLVDGTITALRNPQQTGKKAPAWLENAQVHFGVYHLEKADVLRGEPDSPDSDYKLTISERFANPDQAAAVRKDSKEAVTKLTDHLASAVEAGLVRIEDVRLASEQPQGPAATSVWFQVTTAPTMSTRRIWFSQPSLFYGALPLSDVDLPLGMQLFILTTVVIYFGSMVSILGGVIITSFFIPNMLRKGTIDLLLAKPIHRWALLVYKYIGGLTFIFINNAFAIVGIWLVLGLRSGIWANWFLLLVFVLTFFFAVLYAVSALIAVLTRSAVTCVLVTIGAWFVLFLVGTAHNVFETNARDEKTKNVPAEKQRWTNNVLGQAVGVMHAVLPRTSDLDHLDNLLILSDFLTGSWAETRKLDPSPIEWGESLLVSGLFIAVMLGLSCWRFGVNDY